MFTAQLYGIFSIFCCKKPYNVLVALLALKVCFSYLARYEPDLLWLVLSQRIHARVLLS